MLQILGEHRPECALTTLGQRRQMLGVFAQRFAGAHEDVLAGDQDVAAREGMLAYLGGRDALLVAGAQVGRRGELGELARRLSAPGEAVELHELVPIAGKDELHVEALGGGVELGLPETMARRLVLGFGLDEGDGNGLRLGRRLDTQGVVDATLGLLERPAVDDLDGAGRLLTADEVLRPTACMNRGIDQFSTSIGLR